MDDQSMFFELIKSLLFNVTKESQSQNQNVAQIRQRQTPTTSNVGSFPSQANGSCLDPSPITSPTLDELATRNLENNHSSNTTNANNNNVTLDSLRPHSIDQNASANWFQMLAQYMSNQHSNDDDHQHHHLHQQQQQNQLMAQHFLHASLNANQLGSLNYLSLINNAAAAATAASTANQQNGCSSHNPFAQISSNPYLECTSNSISNLSSPMPTITSPVVYNATLASSTKGWDMGQTLLGECLDWSGKRKRTNVSPSTDINDLDRRRSNVKQFIPDNYLNHAQIDNNNLAQINNLHQSPQLVGHLQASLTSSSSSSSTTSASNNNYINNIRNESVQAPNTSLSSNIVNNYSITNIDGTNNINNNNNVGINMVETCNNPQAIVAHQPSVPTSSFLAKLTAVTSRTSAHSETVCLDDKNVLDLLEAFYVISDQPDPAAIEMIAKAIKTNSETVVNWYDDKRAKLNGSSTIRRDNESCAGNYDVVDATSDFLSSKSITTRNADPNGIANTSNINRKRAGGRVVTFSEYQRSLLETIFDDNNYLHPQEYEVLSNLIEVPARNIKIWFKNRRSKQRLSGRISGG